VDLLYKYKLFKMLLRDFLQVMNLTWKKYILKAACFSYGTPCLIVTANLVFVRIFAQPSTRPSINDQGEFLKCKSFKIIQNRNDLNQFICTKTVLVFLGKETLEKNSNMTCCHFETCLFIKAVHVYCKWKKT